VRARDPLADPEPLIERVYAYVAYRIGGGADAEDVTSMAIERALRYRSSYDPRKGEPIAWLLGIARSCIDDYLRTRGRNEPAENVDLAGGAVEEDAIRRLTVATAVASLDERDRELVALRYGADLSTREIGRLLGMKANAVDVALHRCRERLRGELERAGYGDEPPRIPVRGTATEASA